MIFKHLNAWMSMEVSNWLVSWFIPYLRDLQPTYIGVTIHLLSTMDIAVPSFYTLAGRLGGDFSGFPEGTYRSRATPLSK